MRFTPSHLSFPLGGKKKQSLSLSIESIVAENAFGGTRSLLSQGTPVSAVIDSTVTQMWLPQDVCNLFAKAFGLKYDSSTGLYLVNNTNHRQLKQMNPSVTFTLGGEDSTGSTTNIVLPYAAFDLQAGIPLFNSTTNYFPLRVAANKDQQVLGRAFLQEAYVFVDWERNNFTIGQAIHQNSTTNIVSVSPLLYNQDSSGLSTGVIIGIAIGACVAIILAIAFAALFIVRSRRKRRAADRKDEPLVELDQGAAKPTEVMSYQVYELSEAEGSKHELSADSLERELDGEDTEIAKFGQPKLRHEVYELP